MWPFSDDESGDNGFPNRYGMTDVDLSPDARHVDVAILWGVGMERQAHALARELRPSPRRVIGFDDEVDNETLRRVREESKENTDD